MKKILKRGLLKNREQKKNFMKKESVKKIRVEKENMFSLKEMFWKP